MNATGKVGQRASTSSVIELLLILSRTAPDRLAIARARELMADPTLDWRNFIEAASFHGVVSAVFRNITGSCCDLLPPAQSAELKRRYEEVCRSRLALLVEFVKVNRLLQESEIEALNFKGFALAAQTYEDFFLRSCEDLDICVKRTDVGKTLSLLEENGYAIYTDYLPGAKLPPTDLLVNLWPPEVTLKKGRRVPIYVDLHWEIQPRHFLPIDTERLWAEPASIVVSGAMVPTVGPEMHLIVVCVHGTKSLWRRLVWVCDVANFVTSQKIDWTKLFSMAEQLRVTRMVTFGLFLANRLMATPLPDVKAVREINSGFDSLLEIVRQNLSLLVFQPGLTTLQRWNFQNELRTCTLDKFRVPWLELFCPTVKDWTMRPLPSELAWLYYLLHPLSKLGSQLAKLISLDGSAGR